MIAALLCLLLAANEPPAVKLTPKETAVIAAAMDVAFPDRGRTLYVGDHLPIASANAPAAARAINGVERPLAGLDIGRPVKLAGVSALSQAAASSAAAVILTRPLIDGDRAILEYHTVTLTRSGVIGGHSEATLERTERGWEVTRILFYRDFPPVRDTVPPPPSVAAHATDAPLRVGGDVKAPVVEYRVNPIATPEAKAAHISGIVILEIIVDATGKVTDAKILKPLPFGLDQAALDAVRQWRFRPGTLNGVPVAVIYNITMNFKDGD